MAKTIVISHSKLFKIVKLKAFLKTGTNSITAINNAEVKMKLKEMDFTIISIKH